MTSQPNPYLNRVSSKTARVAGVLLLAAAGGLTAVLLWLAWPYAFDPAVRRGFNSSTMLSGLLLLALCLMSWQAGFRLVARRPDGAAATLFSRPAWIVIGLGMIGIAAVMGAVIWNARAPTLLDWQVVLTIGGMGVWCVILGFRR
jgi:hypothetical protein